MAEETQITTEVKGTTTTQTTGPYGEPGCEETMHVVHNGEDIYVPFTNVRASGYDFYGAIPDHFDVDRIVEYDGHIHAEADVEGGIVELRPDYNDATAEFCGYDSWELQLFDTDSPSDSIIIWTRE